MLTLLKSVLSVNEVAAVNEIVLSEALIDGRATSVVTGKHNLQLPLDSRAAQQAGRIVLSKLLADEEFERAVQPAITHQPLFSRYEVDMEYPDHIDVAIMSNIRTDVAVTLFLSDLASYDGGELVVDTGNGARAYRLEAGDAVAYPATFVHHVARVTRGVRLAAVLWVQSLVRDPQQRRILYDLARYMNELADTACGPRLRRSYWNLLRLWAETAPPPREPGP
jgi:PKHD-type hydroxylase